MKKLRKIVSLLLAVVMMMSLCIVVTADTQTVSVGNGDGSLTIDYTTVGETYSIYKLLDMTYDSENDSYAYTIDSSSAWYKFFATGDGATYVTLTAITGTSTTYYAEWKDAYKDDTDAVIAFAAAALAYAEDSTNGVSATSSVEALQTTITFKGLDLGYYLVSTTLGSVLALDSTNTSVTINDKNAKPLVTKTIYEDSSELTENTASIGDTITYHIKVSGLTSLTTLTVHDILGSGLTFNSGSISIVLYDSTGSSLGTLSASTHYSVDSTTSFTDGCTFEIDLDAFLADTLYSSIDSDSDYLLITYTATVNSNAIIASTGNVNTASASCGTKYVSSTSSVTTYVYELYIYKYNGSLGSSETPLSGAVFTLKDSDGNYITVDGSDGVYTVTGTTGTYSSSTCNIETYSSPDGFIYIKGLADGTYTLTEIEAPDGYSLPSTNSNSTTITITSGSYSGSNVSYSGKDVNAVAVENSETSAMPSTGGIGTTIFYVVGGVLVVGAVILLITKKRMKD